MKMIQSGYAVRHIYEIWKKGIWVCQKIRKVTMTGYPIIHSLTRMSGSKQICIFGLTIIDLDLMFSLYGIVECCFQIADRSSSSAW